MSTTVKIQSDGGDVNTISDGGIVKVQTTDCCPSETESIEVTFAGVTECPGGGWPSDLNTTFVLPYAGNEATYWYWEDVIDGWDIRFHCYKATCFTMLFFAKIDGGAEAFKSDADTNNPKANLRDTDAWCDIGYVGYGGNVTWGIA